MDWFFHFFLVVTLSRRIVLDFPLSHCYRIIAKPQGSEKLELNFILLLGAQVRKIYFPASRVKSSSRDDFQMVNEMPTNEQMRVFRIRSPTHRVFSLFACGASGTERAEASGKHRRSASRPSAAVSFSLYSSFSLFRKTFFTLIHSLILRANFDDSPRLQNNGKSRRHSREEKVSLISVLVIGARRRNFKLHRAARDYSRSRVRFSFNDLGDDPQSSSREERKARNELKFNSSSE